MAKPEHLAKLKEGIAVWNKWRELNSKEAIDLRNAHLSETDLRHADLHNVNLTAANLSSAYLEGARLGFAKLFNANLNGANLNGADINGAYLSRADLGSAQLRGTNLRSADLRGAKLCGAKLKGANLMRAYLTSADLSNAYLADTLFVDTDLSNAVGIESCQHRGHSTIDHRTLAISGPLPLPFLRGCGLPEPLITYLPSLFNHAIQFYSCFISYSTKDQEFADRLHADLQNKGVRCWFAPEDLKIGDHFRNKIDESIRLHDKLLIVLSENSIQSPWVATEVESAFEREHRQNDRPVLFPIRLDDGVMKTDQAWAADIRRRRHIGDFSGWKDHDSYQRAFDRLLRDLKADEAKARKA